jgi:hypothetical protein
VGTPSPAVALVLARAGLLHLTLFASADSTDDAMQQFREIYSPTNIANWLLEIVALSPAIAAYIWRERRRKNALRHQASL